MGGFKYVDEFEFPADAGFTGSAGQQQVRGYARGGHVKAPAPAKVAKTMGEFKKGDLHSGSKDGPKVTNRKQAVAIALNQARTEPMRKAEGGLAVKRRGVPVASSKPIIERPAPKPMAMRPSPEAGDTDPRLRREPSDKRVTPGRDNYAHGGPVKKGLGGAILPALFGLAGLAMSQKKKKKGQDEGPPPPVNAAQALAQRSPSTAASVADDQTTMKRGGRVKG